MKGNNKRFSGALAGKNLATIGFSAPHQKKFQRLVGETLKKYFSGFNLPKINIIEIGTGAGLTSFEILKADRRIILRSVDNEPKMVTEAKTNLKMYIYEKRLGIILNDALKFLKSIPKNSVDSVATSMTLHNFKRDYREKVLREILRVLKTDGLFINADKYVPDNKEKYKKEFDWQMKQFGKAPTPKIKKAWIEHYETDNHPDIIMREGEAKKIMQKIGFKNIRIGKRQHLEALLTARK
jgi:ubiquinone/menaquinone biosynthesis C-methylase UbiE